MAGAGIGNVLGAVPIFDFGNPKQISGQVRNEIISGGVFVFGSGATGVVGSGANSFANSDLLFTRDASGTQFNGICVDDTAVSGNIAVATDGIFILQCNGTVVCGEAVKADGKNSVQPLGSTADSLAKGPSHKIGRAITSGASGGFAVIQLTP